MMHKIKDGKSVLVARITQVNGGGANNRNDMKIELWAKRDAISNSTGQHRKIILEIDLTFSLNRASIN